jgi:membrane protein required for colicin V production
MNNLDLILIGFTLFCGILGLYWGIIRQVLAIVGLLAGLAIATSYEHSIADLLSSVITEETLARAVAFVLIVVIVSGAASLAASLLRKLAGLLFLGWADHLIGGALGLVQGTLIATAALIVMTALPNQLWTPLVQESQIARPLVGEIGPLLFGLLPESFRLAAQMMMGIQ